MNLNTRDVARMLNVSEKTIYRMAKAGLIPCFRVGGQWRFDKREIISWLEDVKGKEGVVTKDAVEEDMPISELIKRGGIYYRVSGNTKDAVIRNALMLVKSGHSAEYIDRLYNAVMERERRCSTAIGHGIALPHPRPFKGFTSPLSSISLAFLEMSVPFDAIDNEDVFLLLFISPKDEGDYLRIQARLLNIIREKDCLLRLKDCPLREEIYRLFSEKELRLSGGMGR